MSIFSASLAGRLRGRLALMLRTGVLGACAASASLAPSSRLMAADLDVDAVKVVIGDAVPEDAIGQYGEVWEGIQRFRSGDLTGARRALESAKKNDAKLPPPELMLAKIMASAAYNAQQFAPIIRNELENCVKQHPEDPEPYLIFGDQAFAERKFTDADLLFSRAKKLAADYKDNQKRARTFKMRSEAGLASVAEAREQWDDARAHVEAWLAIVDPPGTKPRDPSAAVAHDRLAKVLFRADASDTTAKKSLDEFTSAIDADKRFMSPQIAMAQLYEEAAQKANAKSDKKTEERMHEMARRFVDLAVKNLPAESKLPPRDSKKQDERQAKMATLLAASHWALETDQPAEAKLYAQQAYDTDPTNTEAKFLRGVAARLNGDTKTAEAMFEDVFSQSPTNFAASNQYAQVLAEQNDKVKRAKAFEIAQINEKMNSGQQGGSRSVEAAATLGWVLYQMGDLNNAQKVIQAVVQSGNPTPDSLYYAAEILKQAGQPEKGVPLAKAALKLSKAFVHHKEAKALVDKYGKGSSDKDDATSDTSKTDSGKGDGSKDTASNK